MTLSIEGPSGGKIDCGTNSPSSRPPGAGALSELIADLDVGADWDADELAEVTQRLRAQLLDLDVDGVELRAEAPESGAKGIGLLGIGGLIVRFSLESELLRAIAGRVVDWLSRQRVRSVKLTLDGDSLELTGVSSAEQQQLIDLWVARHADPA